MAQKWTIEKDVKDVVVVEKDFAVQSVKAQRVIIKGFEDVEFYVYNVSDAETKTYAVCERTSGVMTSTVERGKKQAIESCLEHIRVFGAKDGKEFMSKLSEIVPFQAFVVVAAQNDQEEEVDTQ